MDNLQKNWKIKIRNCTGFTTNIGYSPTLSIYFLLSLRREKGITAKEKTRVRKEISRRDTQNQICLKRNWALPPVSPTLLSSADSHALLLGRHLEKRVFVSWKERKYWKWMHLDSNPSSINLLAVWLQASYLPSLKLFPHLWNEGNQGFLTGLLWELNERTWTHNILLVAPFHYP